MTIVTGVSVGDVLAGKYRVERIIGMGGMGVVVAAHHLQLDERVALKFLLPDALVNGEAVARFAREARAAVKIKNEHVARVSDVGRLENGAPYMVMEYLDGVDLATLIKQRGQISIFEVIDYVLQACEALAEAHGLGIIHRDLKPANLFIIRRPDGSSCVKLLDFGISKVTGGGSGADMGMTRTTAVMGSPLYMSPEQMESTRSVDARTDIWALGVILYELLSGRPPFEGETLPEICVKIATHPLPPLASRRPGLPRELEAAVARCLAKDRNGRFSNVGELALALVGFGPPHSRASVDRVCKTVEAAGHAIRASAPPPTQPPADELRRESGRESELVLNNATFGSSRLATRSRGGKMTVLAFMAVVGVGVAGTALLRRSAVPVDLAASTPVAAAPVAQPIETNPRAALPVAPALDPIAPRPDPPASSAEPQKDEPARPASAPRPAPPVRPLGPAPRPAALARPTHAPADPPAAGNAPLPQPPANVAPASDAPPAGKGNVYDDRK